MRLINTKLDDFYLNPYKFIYKKDSDEIIKIINNIIDNKSNINKNNSTISENINDFNPLLFKLVANNNIVQLQNILKTIDNYIEYLYAKA